MNPRRGHPARPLAVALKYDRAAQPAPTVTAKGAGEVARRILELARRNDVPVREDGDLLELLSACDLGQEIPGELYHAVAELLVCLHRLNGERAA